MMTGEATTTLTTAGATLLRRFSGVVEAAKEDLDTVIRDRREYLIEKYGPDPSKAFSDADPLDLPRLASETQQEVINRMEMEVMAARRREEEARAAAKVTEKERKELEKFKQRKEEKRRKTKRKQRAAQSKKGKKRGRKRKKK